MANKLKKFTQITLQREAQNLVTAQGCLYAPGLHATCLGCWQLTSPSCLPPSPLRAPMPTSPGEKHAKPLRWPVDWQTRGQVAGLPLIHTFNISAIHTVKFFSSYNWIWSHYGVQNPHRDQGRTLRCKSAEDLRGCEHQQQTREGKGFGYKGENRVPLGTVLSTHHTG